MTRVGAARMAQNTHRLNLILMVEKEIDFWQENYQVQYQDFLSKNFTAVSPQFFRTLYNTWEAKS